VGGVSLGKHSPLVPSVAAALGVGRPALEWNVFQLERETRFNEVVGRLERLPTVIVATPDEAEPETFGFAANSECSRFTPTAIDCSQCGVGVSREGDG
jgi:hypothetical protein